MLVLKVIINLINQYSVEELKLAKKISIFEYIDDTLIKNRNRLLVNVCSILIGTI
jgi:translation initiation factor 2 beta subunit (eIF-2beta)/eIF-5